MVEPMKWEGPSQLEVDLREVSDQSMFSCSKGGYD